MFNITHKIRGARDLRTWYYLNGVYRDHNGNIGHTYGHIRNLDKLIDETRDGWDQVFEEINVYTTDLTPEEAEAIVNAYDGPIKED